MATSLYRKHRPQTFGDISGQRHILTTLRHELAADRVAHAYLFAGPRGTGKTTTARVLAKAVNCLQRAAGVAEPCNACLACESIRDGHALDVMEIDAASHTGVDHVREHIIAGTRVSPTSLRRKVFIIDEVHMLSPAAFNALLKTLEEPPEKVLFILATTEVGKLPATIISRCQRFDFKNISAEDMLERLTQLAVREGREVARPVLEAIVANAEGSVRDAESLLEQVMAVGDDPVTLEQAQLVLPTTDAKTVIEFLTALTARQVRPALALIDRISREGMDLPHFAATVTAWMRAVLLLKSGAPLSDLGVPCTAETARQLQAVAEPLHLGSAVTMITVWNNRCAELKYAALPQLPLELAAVDICLQGGATAAPGGKAPEPAKPPSGEFSPASPPSSPPPRGRKSKSTREKPLSDVPGNPAPAAVVSRPEEPLSQSAPSPAGESAPAVASKTLGLDEIIKLWPAVLAEVKTKNYSLFSLLRVMRPHLVTGSVLQVGGAFGFHLERLSERKNSDILEQVLATVLGVSLRVEGVMVPAGQPPVNAAEEQVLQTFLQDFGGKVVE